jgi:microcystin-dependent protein
MSDPFLGEIRMTGFNFAPVGWALCWGQTLGIAQNQALFSLLGVSFGGNGTTTFNLPDLRGRSPVGTGAAPGLTPIEIGQIAGAENVSLTINNLPAHTHIATVTPGNSTSTSLTIPATTTTSAEGSTPGPTTVLGPASAGGRAANVYSTSAANTTLAPFNVMVQGSTPTVQNSIIGNSQPAAIRNPYLGVTCIIALQGIFPSRG